MSKEKLKVRGQVVHINLYKLPLWHLETFWKPNQCTTDLVIQKAHKTSNIHIKFGWWNMCEKEQNEIIREIKSLKSVTTINQVDNSDLYLKLNSGHPFLEDFLCELGRMLERKLYHPDIGPIQLVDENGRPINEAINEKVRTREWIVTLADKRGYSSNIILRSAKGLYMTREQAMDKMKVSFIEGSETDIEGNPFVYFIIQNEQIESWSIANNKTSRTMVLEEVT